MRRRIQRLHFVGVGGIGMCGLAELLHAQGYQVTGSDLREAITIDRLRTLGVPVWVGHEATRIGDPDAVVVSSAIPPSNPELAAAVERGIPVVRRGELLAEVMRGKQGVVVAGSHGKTTTSALVAHLLQAAGLDPSFVVGGRLRPPDGSTDEATGARLGGGDLFVAESDESDGSFLALDPVIAVVTTVDPEHLDHWGSADAMRDAFVAFANRVPFWGLCVLGVDHPGVRALRPRVTGRVRTYGLAPGADLTADDLVPDGPGTRFAVRADGKPLGLARIGLPGSHNVANALAAVAVARELELPFDAVADGLSSFPGVERRFQILGRARGVEVVDDYAHHPEEIRATLAAARATHAGRLVAVFQPHRYTRTRDLFEAFAASFDDADRLILTEVYPAGETPLTGIDAEHLAEAAHRHGHPDVHVVRDLDALADALAPELRDGDRVLTLGAGSITTLGPRLLAALEAGS